ncbi:MAG: sigma-70 family RNA polymerase sigma factor [bacterium]|mgnify:FL=1|nr:sigma-70 family RNA polymerase sigma factor [Muribaculaceae bacterium]MDD5817706.1 sigma-70 family RNA polymerase sigma factor [bacterium]MDD6833092.1 sigma-70 family RNA polymerase sigma factor [bacterium]MDD6900248.1 sigma-70 family RNA polymerase sigma factor [bacterium]
METLKERSDERLIALYVDGNNEAFDVLIDRHKDRVYSYILHYVKNPELADDIFQETFVKAIVTIKQNRYVENGRFSAWITRIAHNLIFDYFRKEKSENLQSTDAGDINILNRKELSEATVEDHIILSQIETDIHRLIMALPENQREVLQLRYFKDMSFKEIAMLTNVSINTALGRMRYAILNMRKMAQENHISLSL